MTPEQKHYFDEGVKLGKFVYERHLEGNSLSASRYDETCAGISLKNAFLKSGQILPHQDYIKRGIILGVKTAGIERPELKIVRLI